MCSPDENPVVCAIIEERNNEADELAKAEGGRRVEVAKRKAEAQFWKEYVAGLPDGAALKGHMSSLCAWKGPQSQPAAKMCQWWDDNYVAHPVEARGK